jgi:signal transduction histidine kinase/DNA-binding response OmpR family regulator
MSTWPDRSDETPNVTTRPSPEDCLSGGGEMGALTRSTRWNGTAFGAVSEWPQSLRTAISIMLESRFAMVVAWGPEFRFFYNDRYRPILGTKHPAALGAPGVDIFPEVWPVVGPEFERVRRGEAFAVDDWLLPLDRNGYLENCWFTLSYSPIRDETGGVGGVLAVVAETTGRVEGERRLATLRELARRAADADTPEQACRTAAEVFGANAIDVPFALIYLLEADGVVARRVSSIGIAADHPANVESINIESSAADVWRIADVIRTGETVVHADIAHRIGALSGGPYEEHPHTAMLLPLSRPGSEHPYGVLVAGVSPRRALDDRYRGFFELAADHIATGISNAVALEEARRRAAALAEIDRAKTAFFSNVSHEFRTPLTLMLGPAADLLSGAHGPLTGAQRGQVDILQRNASRLLKLVNALLDFSRIEAGRTQASYVETDIAALTRELAGAFRSLLEHAGLHFEVECESIGEPVYVDRDMWEKIVLNLLSNAFKFTFQGSVRLALRRRGDAVELEVRDTGAGIPERELPRIFDRFHRVEGTRSRTFEGSGIGLALTDELVRLHGGTITVASRPGEGSVFLVTIPIGCAHLPPDRIGTAGSAAATAAGVAPFVDEALHWLPAASAEQRDDETRADAGGAATSRNDTRERILVVDDNADMREYLRQLLCDWHVEIATDGAFALEAARSRPPDLVVTDVMMPRLDGFGLLRELKSDPQTRGVPVLMLSARAGEEARVSGLSAGADDYVIKPFSARELTARVHSLLALSKARREAELQKQHLHSLFMQAPTPIVIMRGPRHVVELANPLTCQVWGRTEPELVGKPLLDALPELVDQPFKELLDQVLRTGVPYVGKETPARLDRDGTGALETVYFNFVYAPLRGVDDAIDGILVMAFDVTDEVTARNEMSRLRASAEAANRAKDEFLAMLGHELRNPLAPILTALQLMTLRGDGSALKERTVIDRQVRHLVRLVDDLLDVSRIARGKVDLRRQQVEIGQIVAMAVETSSPLLEKRHHRLDVDVPPSGLLVHGDVTRLTQVVVNVISNAAKYTEPHGHIRVAAIQAGDFVELRVRDTGAGISAEMLPRVFELFSQERQTLDRAHGGLGLGLTIVRSLVELHGGSVEARSDGVGHGSEFVLRLPVARHESGGRVRPASRDTGSGSGIRAGHRILVVDDNVDAARLTAEALEAVGHDARVAFDGPEALAIATTFAPDLALLDLGLPLMDGYELAEQLVEAMTNKPPVLVAVTGYGQPSDRERTEAAGFHGHIVKPVDFGELTELLDRLLAEQRTS